MSELVKELPEIITDPEEKKLAYTAELQAAAPWLTEAVEYADDEYGDNPYDYVKRLKESMFTVQLSGTSTGEVACSLLESENKTDEMLVIFAPFADCEPKSSAEDIYGWMTAKDDVSKGKGAPNSWNQIVKSAVTADMLEATDHGMPVLTIFSPIPRYGYTFAERRQFRDGDFSPAARLVSEAVDTCQQKLGLDIDKLHFSGASLGANNALGAARGTNKEGAREVGSVTAQELIIGPSSLLTGLGPRFFFKSATGKESNLKLPNTTSWIGEPMLRQAIDRGENEFAMGIRNMKQITKWTYLSGLLIGGLRHSVNETARTIDELVDADVPLLIPQAQNSGMTQDTESHMRKGKEDILTVRSIAGARAGHLINEHVLPSATLTVLNVLRTQ